MKAKGSYEEPKSAFLGMDKDQARMMDKILENQKILKLLYYSTPDSLEKPNLTGEQIKSLLDNEQITNVPRIQIEKEALSRIQIYFDDFSRNDTNPYYRDHIIKIKIICPFDLWTLKNFQLRPYRIAGEIDSMFSEKRFSGIGVLNFLNSTVNMYDEYYAGITMKFLAIRGNEDKINPLS